jgi:hypothetical protein
MDARPHGPTDAAAGGPWEFGAEPYGCPSAFRAEFLKGIRLDAFRVA